MTGDKMQSSRFELKYVISEVEARRLREYVRSFLDMDEYCVGRPDFSYPVHSLYLDSAGMKTYWDTINGNKNRFKLRIRYYTDEPEAPVFLEIKRRMNNCIKKQRAAVRRDSVRAVLAGQLLSAKSLLSSHPKHLVAMQNFCRMVQEIQAQPKVHVAYLREAYLPRTDNSARLTMDRQVRSEPDPGARLSTQMRNPIHVWGDAVVLELKFTDRYPNWFRDLVQTFNLRQCGAAKYADGVALLNGQMPEHQRMPRPNPDLRWPLGKTAVNGKPRNGESHAGALAGSASNTGEPAGAAVESAGISAGE
jgi:SPX domain protein involved in polyphosphate accumulation